MQSHVSRLHLQQMWNLFPDDRRTFETPIKPEWRAFMRAESPSFNRAFSEPGNANNPGDAIKMPKASRNAFPNSSAASTFSLVRTIFWRVASRKTIKKSNLEFLWPLGYLFTHIDSLRLSYSSERSCRIVVDVPEQGRVWLRRIHFSNPLFIISSAINSMIPCVGSCGWTLVPFQFQST